jgi:ribosomal protein S18 acetylase RimI-like enzyme
VTTIDSGAPARPAGPGDRDELNRVLAAAFLDDPIVTWMVPDRPTRERLMPEMFDAFADAFARHDATRLVAAGDGDSGVAGGAAMWSPPGVAPVHPDDEEAMSLRLADLAGPHLDRMGTCMAVFEEAHPSEPAWFLQFVGVDPACQGRGLGARLLRDVLDVADRDGEAAYLEATSEQNRRLYERHGFRRVADLPMPDGPTAYAMWRDPGAG